MANNKGFHKAISTKNVPYFSNAERENWPWEVDIPFVLLAIFLCFNRAILARQ